MGYRALGVTPTATSEAVRRVMKANRGRDTRPELELRGLLRKAGYPGYRVQWKTPAGKCDLAFPGRRVAVFVHGCFWHRCPICDLPLPRTHHSYWRKKFELTKSRDERVRLALAAQGWKVVTVWECQIKCHPEQVLRDLRGVLDNRAGPPDT